MPPDARVAAVALDRALARRFRARAAARGIVLRDAAGWRASTLIVGEAVLRFAAAAFAVDARADFEAMIKTGGFFSPLDSDRQRAALRCLADGGADGADDSPRRGGFSSWKEKTRRAASERSPIFWTGFWPPPSAKQSAAGSPRPTEAANAAEGGRAESWQSGAGAASAAHEPEGVAGAETCNVDSAGSRAHGVVSGIPSAENSDAENGHHDAGGNDVYAPQFWCPTVMPQSPPRGPTPQLGPSQPAETVPCMQLGPAYGHEFGAPATPRGDGAVRTGSCGSGAGAARAVRTVAGAGIAALLGPAAPPGSARAASAGAGRAAGWRAGTGAGGAAPARGGARGRQRTATNAGLPGRPAEDVKAAATGTGILALLGSAVPPPRAASAAPAAAARPGAGAGASGVARQPLRPGAGAGGAARGSDAAQREPARGGAASAAPAAKRARGRDELPRDAG